MTNSHFGVRLPRAGLNLKRNDMINKCTFIGNLGKDPDYKVLESGHKVASFSIACSRKVKNKENGETKEYTEWIPIVAWDNLMGTRFSSAGPEDRIIIRTAPFFARRFREPVSTGFCSCTISAGTSGPTAACAGNA